VCEDSMIFLFRVSVLDDFYLQSSDRSCTVHYRVEQVARARPVVFEDVSLAGLSNGVY